MVSSTSQSLSDTDSKIEKIVIDESSNSALVTFKTESAAKECLKVEQIISFGKVLHFKAPDSSKLTTKKSGRLISTIKFSSVTNMVHALSREQSLQQLDILGSGSSVSVQIELVLSDSQVQQTKTMLTSAFGDQVQFS